MERNYLHHSTKIGEDGFDSGIKFGEPHKEKCAYCGNVYNRYHSEVEYTYNGKHFCSWDCKCKYKRNNNIHTLTEPQKNKLKYAFRKYKVTFNDFTEFADMGVRQFQREVRGVTDFREETERLLKEFFKELRDVEES